MISQAFSPSSRAFSEGALGNSEALSPASNGTTLALPQSRASSMSATDHLTGPALLFSESVSMQTQLLRLGAIHKTTSTRTSGVSSHLLQDPTSNEFIITLQELVLINRRA